METNIIKIREVYRITHGETKIDLYFFPDSLRYEILRIRIERSKIQFIEEFVKFYAVLLIIQRLISHE